MARPAILWSYDEEIWLKENYSDSPWDKLIAKLKKTKIQIRSKASRLGVSRNEAEYSLFTPIEDELIKTHWTMMDEKDFLEQFMPYRTIMSIRVRASRLGIRKRPLWTKEELEFLETNFGRLGVKELVGALPNHSRNSVYNRIKLLGLTGCPTFSYTEDDVIYIANNYTCKSDVEIAHFLHRAPKSIKGFRNKLRLYRKDPNAPTHYASFDRLVQRNNIEWKRDAMEACGYRCILTDEAFENIHHLYAKNLIIKEALKTMGLDETVNIDTCDEKTKYDFLQAFYTEQLKHPKGLCLTKKIHMRFHDIYRYGDNTPEQFYEFVENYFPDKLDKIKSIV